jgi:adenylate kinase
MQRGKPKIIVGITGPLGAGKTEVAKFFERKGFNYYSLSDTLREVLKSRGEIVSRDNLFKLGNELREKFGSGYIAEKLRQKLVKPSVVDSIRSVGEVEEFRKDKDFILILVDAPANIRYQRLIKRAREGEENLTFEEFIEKENREFGKNASEQQLHKVAAMADFKIDNDSTMDSLMEKLEKLYKKILSRYNCNMISGGLTFVFLGRSGSGKGTQIQKLIEYLGVEDIICIVTGNLFRELSKMPTIIGKKVLEELKTGELPPDWLATTLWQNELINKLVDINQIIIFDGALRRVNEAIALEKTLEWLNRPKAIPILIDITREEAYRRLKLRQREDDKDEAIERRLNWYDEDVIKVVEFYEDMGRLIRIDGMPSPDKVFENLISALSSEISRYSKEI